MSADGTNAGGGLRLDDIHHAYGRVAVLRGVTVGARAGELVCLLGPSGSGKSTLLRLAAGLEQVQHGQVTIDGRLVGAPGLHVPPERRNIGLMFQDFALFPHLDVLDNVTFGLAGRDKGQARTRARELLARVGMAEFETAYPHTLSGGQQQRVALARALAPEPRVMLLDEPFSGLDTTLRAQIREETARVLKETGVATLLVTHDPDEAMAMADRIKILGPDGRVRQAGTPDEVYFRPADPFVAELFGPLNRLSGVVRGGAVATALGVVLAPGLADGTEAQVLVRPEGLRIGDPSGVSITVMSARRLGRSSQIVLRPRSGSGGEEYRAQVAGPLLAADGCPETVAIDPDLAFVFKKSEDR